MRFPDLDGVSLLGEAKHLPADLPADPTLVLLAFRQRQQAQVDRWIARAAEAPVVEIPCLGRQWRPMRRFIDGGMASSIGDPVVLARTITVYGGVGALLRAIGADGPAEVQARVVRRDGEILAAASGEPEGDGWEAVAAALRGRPAPLR